MIEYDTILKSSFGEYTEKRSRFISSLVPCKDETQATEILQRIKGENFGANHNVYAYVLSNGTARFSDDGEPHGTAGKPVLDVLAGSGIKDAILVVTRYFGGVLLGTGGLVKAYSTAAKEAVLNAEKVCMCECAVYTATCHYSEKDKLNSVIEKYEGTITKTEYTDNVLFEFNVLSSKCEEFELALRETFSGKMVAEVKEIGIFPVKI